MAPTQDALYERIDLDLSWSERDLPERERTKHVHRLHPYLGKFIPQLVEVLLDRYFAPGAHVLDPFAGSGTTLVQALESGMEATGSDIAAFNCLLMRVKTARYNPFVLERELRDACSRLGESSQDQRGKYVRDWYARQAASELLAFRNLCDEYEHRDVLRLRRDIRKRPCQRIGRRRMLVLRPAAARERDEDQRDGGASQPAACTTSRTAPSGPRRSVFSTRS